MTTHTPARIKPNWKMPEAPLCCGQPMVQKVGTLVDGADWLWRFAGAPHCMWKPYVDCLCCGRRDFVYVEWPFTFVDATNDDFALAGFEVTQ